MCGIDTANGALGMEWGVGNELTGLEFNLWHIKFALSSWVQNRRREADHWHPSRAEDTNGWKEISTHSILQSSKTHFT
jgi:hypothetical protein